MRTRLIGILISVSLLFFLTVSCATRQTNECKVSFHSELFPKSSRMTLSAKAVVSTNGVPHLLIKLKNDSHNQIGLGGFGPFGALKFTVYEYQHGNWVLVEPRKLPGHNENEAAISLNYQFQMLPSGKNGSWDYPIDSYYNLNHSLYRITVMLGYELETSEGAYPLSISVGPFNLKL